MRFSITTEVPAAEGAYDFKIEIGPNIIVGEFKYEILKTTPEKNLETRRKKLTLRGLDNAIAQIKLRRYPKGLPQKGKIVKCLAVSIVGKTDVAAQFFDPLPEWDLS
jgi:hypothetical protein